jgi:Uma2 family endonuclease
MVTILDQVRTIWKNGTEHSALRYNESREEAAMSAQRKPLYTPDKYLELERESEYKSEYIAGEVFAMAGANYEHNLIASNITGELRSQLRGTPCRTLGSDLRIQAGLSGPYFYPDAIVFCGDPQFRSDGRRDTLTNPSVILEVLSPSTEAYDRGEKFAYYRRLESLQEYILVSQTRPRIEHFTRQGDLWILQEFDGLAEAVKILSADCSLALAEVYDGVTFLEEETPGNPPPERSVHLER